MVLSQKSRFADGNKKARQRRLRRAEQLHRSDFLNATHTLHCFERAWLFDFKLISLRDATERHNKPTQAEVGMACLGHADVAV